MKPSPHFMAALVIVGVASCGSDDSQVRGDSADPASSNSSGPNVDQAESSSLSAPGFVRAFYDWYVPIARKNAHVPAWYAVLRRDPPVLNGTLLTALRQDSLSSADSPGQIIGIDFDPFLASQDPCERYELGSVTGVGDTQHVAIHSVCSGLRSAEPDLIAEVSMEDDSWVFQNIRYARPNSDLLKVLNRLTR